MMRKQKYNVSVDPAANERMLDHCDMQITGRKEAFDGGSKNGSRIAGVL